MVGLEERVAFVHVSSLYATGFALLGIWGVYAAQRTHRGVREWSSRRTYSVLVSILFAGSCFTCAVSLRAGLFRAWMMAPLGVSYLLQIPLPCYFDSVNRVRWLHVARNILFGVVVVVCFAIAGGAVPLSRFGL